MKARTIIDELSTAPRVNRKTGRRYKLITFHRDHREVDDDTDMIEANKLARTLPGAVVFEFGNRIVDEYVIVVTDDPTLESHVDGDADEGYLHDLAIVEPDDDKWITFATFDELVEKVKAAEQELEKDEQQ